MIVAAVVCIVERENPTDAPLSKPLTNARALSDESLWQAQKRTPFLRLFSANDVRVEHVKQLGVVDR